MRVLVDTNIILDDFLEREPFVEDAAGLMEAIESERIVGYVTATTLTNIFYIARRQTRSVELARQAVSETLTLMEVCLVDRVILDAAFSSNLRDFEDAVQLACAMASRLDAIITRNAQDFAGATLPILSASELLESLS
ncbi:MAG: putative toxin-antitoxin system toxin component, PIN family [Symplocastrum torsivum CPER-KK1]|jgi:putative PIN family toxin of toxin-antitoxin system|uniref:Toxin-antitoxin system toxin component, PIN family n=1 Tax=Symplocastrum torsivum CPER-KK1 TaxID=450513 RepID=A0A951PLN5_9CYAN|nr:putative toxin-antitoxin system toxin component, PIN family [Symplocastrum torsivum CPER-KK1]